MKIYLWRQEIKNWTKASPILTRWTDVAEKLPYGYGETIGELWKKILEGTGNKCIEKGVHSKINEYIELERRRRRHTENVGIFGRKETRISGKLGLFKLSSLIKSLKMHIIATVSCSCRAQFTLACITLSTARRPCSRWAVTRRYRSEAHFTLVTHQMMCAHQTLYCPKALFTLSTHQTLYSALGRSKPGTHVSVTEFSVLVADRL